LLFVYPAVAGVPATRRGVPAMRRGLGAGALFPGHADSLPAPALATGHESMLGDFGNAQKIRSRGERPRPQPPAAACRLTSRVQARGGLTP